MLSSTTSVSEGSRQAVGYSSTRRADFYQLLSLHLWGKLPAAVQRQISRVYSNLYNQTFSKHFIKPYCKIHYPNPDYLAQFKPPQGKANYENFQDFFTRLFKERPTTQSAQVWPCEGLLCHFGRVGSIPNSNVKGDRRSVADIFGVEANTIPDTYQFSNVFLHNKNYHRIHAPINGTISRIQHVPGELVILRPWIYRHNPSIPAFRNERVNIDMIDEQGRTWYLSIVGGPAVGTIELPEEIKVGNSINILDELAVFYLGSTCCMASPEVGQGHQENQLVWMGDNY